MVSFDEARETILKGQTLLLVIFSATYYDMLAGKYWAQCGPIAHR